MFRNLWHVIRHFKMAFVLNVLGLAVAFMAFMAIMMQVRHDLTFDSCYEEAENIFRLDIVIDGKGQAIICRPMARLFAGSSPAIAAGCITQNGYDSALWQIEKDGDMRGHYLQKCNVSPGILDVFSFNMTEGDRSALKAPGSAVIPESLAETLFGDRPATGRILHATDSTDIDRTITGVYRDFPRNASLKNAVYTSMDPQENIDSWSNWNYYCFLRLSDPSEAGHIIENFRGNLREIFQDSWKEDSTELVMTSIGNLHFKSAVLFDELPKASMGVINALIAIAFIIILIAGINFTNFSTALAPMRIKGINTRRILGSPDTGIRAGLTAEIIMISLMAFAISIIGLHLAGHSPLKELLDCSIAPDDNVPVIWAGLGIAVIAGLVSGLYPSFYMTSVPLSLVLKGSFGLSPAGRRLRGILIGVQFTASFAIIITASFIYLQNRFMLDYPLGFDKDRILVADINSNVLSDLDAFSGEVLGIPGVDDLAYSMQTVSSGDFYMTWGLEHKGRQIDFACIPASVELCRTLGIQVHEGRDFTADDTKKEDASYIFNETARKLYGLEAGDRLPNGEIVGFVPDIRFTSFRQTISPMAFMLPGSIQGYFRIAYIRVSPGTDIQAVRNEVMQCLRKFDPGYPFNVRPYDSILENTYRKEQRTGTLITLFSLIAIFISAVGVFSSVMFDCEYRRKETAARKVLGSGRMEITGMFCTIYMKILVPCFIIGAPAAWYASRKWMESFAGSIPLHWWVFLAAFAAVAALTSLIVICQSWRVANENPVKNLRAQ